MAVVTVVSYDGNSLNDTKYYSYLPESSHDPAAGSPITAGVNFDYPRFVANKKQAKDQLILIVDLLGVLTDAQFVARHDELDGWFSTQTGEEQYLVATFADGTTRRIACRPISVKWEWRTCTVTLKAFRPLWEDNVLHAEDWEIIASGDTTAITIDGNVNVAPVLRLEVKTASLNGYRFKHPIVVRNTTYSRLKNYPLEVTDGGFDTAALIANSAKATTLTAGIGSTDTTIPVASVALLYSSGLVYIGTEQIRYGSISGLDLIDCERGLYGTTATSHASGAALYQSEMCVDGSDLRVEIDGAEVDRWVTGINTSTTKAWVNFPDLPARDSTHDAGDYATNGTNLATEYGTGICSSHKSGAPAAKVVNGKDNEANYWQAGGKVPQWIGVSLSSAKTINRLRLFLSRYTSATPKAFEIQATNDSSWSTYTVIKSVTNQPNPPGTRVWYTYDFDAVSYRYWRIYITAVWYTGAYPVVYQIELYNTSANIVLKYGNPVVPAYQENDTNQPLLTLANSDNDTWAFDAFYDAANTNRTAQWAPDLYITNKQQQRTYSASEASSGDVLGIGTKASTTTICKNAWVLSQPCGISQIIFSGHVWQNAKYRKLTIYGVDSDGDRTQIYQNTGTQTAWTALTSLTYSVSPVAVNLVVTQLYVASSTAAYGAEVTALTLTISTPPTVIFQAALGTTSVNMEIRNTTTGQSAFVSGLVPTDTAIDIDCEAHSIAEVLSGTELVGLVTADAVRDFWLELQPGANTLQLTDEDVVALDIQVRYRDQWL